MVLKLISLVCGVQASLIFVSVITVDCIHTVLFTLVYVLTLLFHRYSSVLEVYNTGWSQGVWIERCVGDGRIQQGVRSITIDQMLEMTEFNIK